MIDWKTEWKPLAWMVAAFAVFCVLSGAVYIINDLADIDKERQGREIHHAGQNRV